MYPLSPQRQFAIVRKLADPSDTGTYYVRAYIRDSVTGDLLSTYDLTDAGNQRFTRVVQAPSDPSGLGRQIDITTKVFSNSGYTVQNTSYADEVNDYWVAEPYNYNLNRGGGGGVGQGPDIDYKKIRKIVSEESASRKELESLKDSVSELAVSMASINAGGNLKDSLSELMGTIESMKAQNDSQGVQMAKVDGDIMKLIKTQLQDFSDSLNLISDRLNTSLSEVRNEQSLDMEAIVDEYKLDFMRLSSIINKNITDSMQEFFKSFEKKIVTSINNPQRDKVLALSKELEKLQSKFSEDMDEDEEEPEEDDTEQLTQDRVSKIMQS